MLRSFKKRDDLGLRINFGRRHPIIRIYTIMMHELFNNKLVVEQWALRIVLMCATMLHSKRALPARALMQI